MPKHATAMQSSGGLGWVVGFDVHAAWYLMPWLESHIAATSYYGLTSTDALSKGSWSVSAMDGLGKTFRLGRFSFVPYLMGGIFTEHLNAQLSLALTSSASFLMPAAAGGFIVGYALGSRVDLFLKAEAMYVMDKTPALIATAGLGVGVRF